MRIEEVVEKYNPDFAFAYGSGVFRQEGYTERDKPMIDFVFGVNSSLDWHRNNLEKNSKDYSLFAKKFGVNFIGSLQKKPAKIYYNTFVNFQDGLIKYGVIEINDLINDLENWNPFYVAGRLHKPTRILKENEKLTTAMKKNLESAVNVALLLLPECFSEFELYKTIAGISYLGDSRGGFENPKKVEKIVQGSFEKFREIYSEVLKHKVVFYNEITYQIKNKNELYENIPKILKIGIGNPSKYMSRKELQDSLKEEIRRIVYWSSLKQTLKGIFTAGFIKSIRYATEKIRKSLR